MVHIARSKTIGGPSTSRAYRPVVCQASKANAIKTTAATVFASAALLVGPAFADGVSFINVPTSISPVHLDFAVEGMTVKPASEGPAPKTGHFHLLIDEGATPEGVAIPFDESHKHFGKGQTSADIELTPGKHTITLQFANAAHESYGPKFAKTISLNIASSE